jgi:hypothetical protein
VLRPGGHLLVETWDRKSWTARLSGRAWHEYSPPSVLHWFTRGGLTRWLRHEGYQLVATGRPSKWISAAHATSLLAHKKEGSLSARLAYALASLVPGRLAIPYLGDDLFWALFRRG